MASNPRHVTSADLFSFLCPKSPSINHLNFYCIPQIDYIFPCACTVIDPVIGAGGGALLGAMAKFNLMSES